MTTPTLRDGAVTIRPIRLRDTRALEAELAKNRAWLSKWEATNPHGPVEFNVRASIKALLASSRAGTGISFAIEFEGEFAGQVNVSGMTYGSVASASIGYWVSERFAGKGVTPTAVALATDHCFFSVGIHRMEICIRPENPASLRVVEKLGFRYEGLRRRFIHINGDWRDHFCFALTVDELPRGVLQRWHLDLVPLGSGSVPKTDRAITAKPLRLS